MQESPIEVSKTALPIHYLLVLQWHCTDGGLYGIRILDSGDVECFGGYDPDEKTSALFRALGSIMTEMLTPQNVPTVRKGRSQGKSELMTSTTDIKVPKE